MSQNKNLQDIKGVKVEYQDGFEDGVKFAREVVIANIRKWADDCVLGEEATIMEEIADRIEYGRLDNDL
jgi:hypothetical protein